MMSALIVNVQRELTIVYFIKMELRIQENE